MSFNSSTHNTKHTEQHIELLKNSEAEVKNKDVVHVMRSPQSCSRQTSQAATDPDQPRHTIFCFSTHLWAQCCSAVTAADLRNTFLQPRCARPLNSVVIPPPPRHPPVGSVSTISCRGLLFSPFTVHQRTSISRRSLTQNLLDLFPASAIK